MDSIYRKLTRASANFQLSRLDDIIGLRVVCQSFQEAQDLGARLNSLPEAFRIKNYVESGKKETGYRCIHNIMRFNQKFNEELTFEVRFEVQVRSFYQHRWAVWSEAHGENVKLGVGETSQSDHERRGNLLELSRRIADWEERNPKAVQHELAKYSDDRNIAVAWKQKNTPPIIRRLTNAEEAIKYLTYLENFSHETRSNVLLLVGLTSEDQAMRLLRETHPLFVTGQAPHPKAWMPKS